MPTAKDLTTPDWERIINAIENGYLSGYIEISKDNEYYGCTWRVTEKGIAINIQKE